MGLLHALGLVASVDELVVLALEGRRLLAEQADEDVARLLEAVAPLAGRTEPDPIGPGLLLIPPAPMPSSRRPPEMMSSVDAMFARTAGCR
jgi:hypothetical protein